jgi:hypothetical protein
VNGKFSDGWDCVVFFTEGIWMAIISVLVMIIIVLFGLNMIASLKTSMEMSGSASALMYHFL